MKGVFLFTLSLAAIVAGMGLCYDLERKRLLTGELYRAMEQGDIDGMHAAIDRGADVNLRVQYPWPLHNYACSVLAEAVRLGKPEVVEALLRRGADPQAKGRW